MLSSETIKHYRKVSNLLDLLGTFGGLLGMALVFASIALGPWTDFAYRLKAQ
jgi:hypothetical protein